MHRELVAVAEDLARAPAAGAEIPENKVRPRVFKPLPACMHAPRERDRRRAFARTSARHGRVYADLCTVCDINACAACCNAVW